MAGVIGSNPRVDTTNKARGKETWVVWVRQGVVELVVLGETVSVIA